jgi:hypothetical protein
VGLHSTIHIGIYMLVELRVDNYATSDGLVNGVGDIFKASTTYCEIYGQYFRILKLKH